MIADRIELQLDLDLSSVKDAIEGAEGLEQNDSVFAALCEVEKTKRALAEAQEIFEEAEREVKRVIKERAGALYGPTWRAIKGSGYKITRSMTGGVYTVAGEADAEFLKIKIEANTDTVGEYIKAHNTLPEGIEWNPNRGEQIRIRVDENT